VSAERSGAGELGEELPVVPGSAEQPKPNAESRKPNAVKCPMSDMDDVIRMLDTCARMPRESGPVRLTAEYLRDIQRVEDMAHNRPGADRSELFRRLAEAQVSHARAVRIR
jgi:hypothetical protein